MKLSEAQTTSLRTTLFILERSLDEITELCDGKVKQGVLYQVSNNLTEREAELIKIRIRSIKKIIAQLAGQLNLKKDEAETRRIVLGRLSLLWENLCSIDSKGLKAYGDVDESLKKELDPLVNQMIKAIEEIILNKG